MRIDKFLKDSRLIKRRTLAKEACDSARVTINGKIAKASDQVKAGDEIAIDFGSRLTKIKVNEGFNTIVNPRGHDMYTLLSQ